LQSVVRAQEVQPERTPEALAMSSSLTFAAAFPVVKNEPFTANVLTQDIHSTPDGKKSIHEAINIHMRDSAGRLRDEQLASPLILKAASLRQASTYSTRSPYKTFGGTMTPKRFSLEKSRPASAITGRAPSSTAPGVSPLRMQPV
jgi:hypothetical protein